MTRLFAAVGVLTLIAAEPQRPAVASTPLTTVRVASGLSRPLFVTHAPGDFKRVFIVEQTGGIKILDLQTSTVLAQPFLNLSSLITYGFDSGLYAVAFHPNYSANGFFYVSYTNAAGNSELARYRVMGDPSTSNVADPASAFSVLTVSEPYPSHDIGWIGFGPKDGFLYITLGDGGGSCDPDQRAQDLTQLHGKMLRIDVDGGIPYGIPASNPFVGVPGADEIWAYGFRNPWRSAFDETTGDLFISENGHHQREEINFQAASSGGGKNYGWDCMEGSACSTISGCTISGCTCGTSDLVLPFYEYDHTVGCSVIGGEVYRGCAIGDLGGTYFFADYCSNKIWSLRYDGTTMTDFQERTAELAPGGGLDIASIVSFGRDAFGEIYVCDQNGGEVFKIVPAMSGLIADCNRNGVEDACDISSGASADVDLDGVPDECVDHFMFYKVKRTAHEPAFERFSPLHLADQLGGTDFMVVNPRSLGLPADKNLEGVIDSVTHLTEYRIGRAPGTPTFQPLTDLHVVNQCNDLLLKVKKPVSVLLPTNKDLSAPVLPPHQNDHTVDHFLCYKAVPQRRLANGTLLPKFPAGIQVDVTDQFESASHRFDLKKVTKLCNPVAKSGNPIILRGPNAGMPKLIDPATIRYPDTHLLCYKAKLATTFIAQNGCGAATPGDTGTAIPAQPPHTPRLGVYINNQFGPLRFDTIRALELCVPSSATLPP